ncbi:PREDICTED: GDSL esterase/lipase At1g20120-like [Fragaria vesca subsp. vesca]|uniref:GDSL esterase/lipase At1g20120-like n=1 Tax=Fragaria vesca subsp. vesca TaxID=101020 RepID=UPI0002C3222B|nr:PREDICTED: GDSL esterase/lipase At1g20120-like [Fragaria vesca subsp. vesca]
MAFLSPKILPSSSSIIVFVTILLILLSHNVAAETLPRNETFPAVFAFGDSILDTGNNDYIISITKSNFPPYGRDFMGGMPTGSLAMEESPQTSLSAIPLSDQLDFFKQYKSKMIAAVGEERAATIISKGGYIVAVGSDDIANNYFTTPLRSPHYDISAYTDLLLESAINFVQELYALGARIIGVLNLPPLGCLPSQRTLHGGIERACYEAENQAAMLFNSKLSTQIDFLNKRLPEAQLFYADIYTPLLSIIQNPAQYGFEVVDKGCCGTGYIEVGPLCNKASPGTCDNVSKYIFWDSFHPTEKAYRILTSKVTEQIL